MTQQTASNKQEVKRDENVNKLGEYLDGWADLVEGMGGKANQVRARAYAFLTAREMPDVKVGEVNGTVDVTKSGRPYILTEIYPNVTTAVYIGEHGKDLYVSWRTFINPTLNVVLIFIAGLVAVFIGLWISSNYFFIDVGQAMISVFIAELLLIGFAGRLFKGHFGAYFLVEPNIFHADNTTAMSLSVHKSVLRALDETGIDVTKLRVKTDFKGGRKGEDI